MRKYDLFTQYALIAATQAVEDSGLDLEKEDLEQIGVIWSSGIGGLKTFFDECLGYAAGDGTPRFSPFFIPRMIADIAAGYISIKYGFMGPNYCTVSACASSNHGLIDSFNAIRFGVADVMVAGGSRLPSMNPAWAVSTPCRLSRRATTIRCTLRVRSIRIVTVSSSAKAPVR